MDRVYIIIDGEYSDWRIIGFTTSEKDAAQVCAGNDYYYIKANRINKIPNNEIYYEYTAYYAYENLKPSTLYPGVEITDYKVCKNNEIPKTRILTGYFNNGKIKIYLKECNYKKAEKIAQDVFYKIKAEAFDL